MFRDFEATTPYSEEECAQYLRNNDTYIQHKGEYIPRDKFLETWDTIVSHATSTMSTLEETAARGDIIPPRRETSGQNDPVEPPPELHITQDGEYYVKNKGTWYMVRSGTFVPWHTNNWRKNQCPTEPRHLPASEVGRRLQVQQKTRVPAS